MHSTREQRFIKAAPREMQGSVSRELALSDPHNSWSDRAVHRSVVSSLSGRRIGIYCGRVVFYGKSLWPSAKIMYYSPRCVVRQRQLRRKPLISQNLNSLANPYRSVRLRLAPPATVLRGSSSVGRAIPCQGIGREFETLLPLQIRKGKVRIALSLFLFCRRQSCRQQAKGFRPPCNMSSAPAGLDVQSIDAR